MSKLGTSREIIALTSLRGIAAMAVVLQHFSVTAQLHAANNIPSLVPHGYLAVDLFFILSGFIMSYTYLSSFELNKAGVFGDFMMRRIARIVPLNLAVLALFVVAAQLSIAALGRNIIYSPNVGIGDIFANSLMLQGLGIGINMNGPSWSVSAEFAAYAIFPLLIVGTFSRHRAARLAVIAISLCGIFWIAANHPRLGMATETIAENLVRCFAEFAIGMATYRAYRGIGTRGAALLGSDRAAFAIMGLCCASMLLRLDLPAVLLFPALIASLALNDGAAKRMMSRPSIYFLGQVSFSLYLLHQLFRPVSLLVVQHFNPDQLGTPAAILFALVSSLCVIPFAWLTYRFVEVPWRRIVRAMGKSRPAPAPIAAVRSVERIH